jgi:hypothetical protein
MIFIFVYTFIGKYTNFVTRMIFPATSVVVRFFKLLLFEKSAKLLKL